MEPRGWGALGRVDRREGQKKESEGQASIVITDFKLLYSNLKGTY